MSGSGPTVEAAVNATIQNATSNNGTLTGRAAATPQGLIVAYCSLVIMALLPIFFGSFRSIGVKKRQKESGEKVESMSKKDAVMFPVIASCTLFGLYVVFKDNEGQVAQTLMQLPNVDNPADRISKIDIDTQGCISIPISNSPSRTLMPETNSSFVESNVASDSHLTLTESFTTENS